MKKLVVTGLLACCCFCMFGKLPSLITWEEMHAGQTDFLFGAELIDVPGDGGNGGLSYGSGKTVGYEPLGEGWLLLVALALTYGMVIAFKSRRLRKAVISTLALLLVVGGSVAQVRIGGSSPVTKGAVLDLRSDESKGEFVGGLLLPRISLPRLDKLPAGFTNLPEKDLPDLEGLLVYNSNTIFGKGVYCWNGKSWGAVSDVVPDTNYVVVNGEAYATRVYGKLRWMTENLRTFSSVDGSDLDSAVSNSSKPHFAYPNKDKKNYDAMGLLYNKQGVRSCCPQGWRLPTEAEWMALRESVAADVFKNDFLEFKPGGIRDGSIPVGIGSDAKYWCEPKINDGGVAVISFNETTSSSSTQTSGYFASVRYVMDIP